MRLKPYHTFNDDTGVCLINIERMTASRIDEATSRMLDRISADPHGPLPPSTARSLKALDLLPDKETPKKREGFAEPAAVKRV